jgi:Amt family ammonium transporter
VHGIGGIVGAVLTGVVAAPALGGFGPGGDEYAIGAQVGKQIWAVLVCIIWSGVVSTVALYIVKAISGLRVPEAAEREGLDVTSHGERAYT